MISQNIQLFVAQNKFKYCLAMSPQKELNEKYKLSL
ncbi:hypothetical protein pb186bvf_017974 [Paramecium bursaria]